jgi:hypothetical protein
MSFVETLNFCHPPEDAAPDGAGKTICLGATNIPCLRRCRQQAHYQFSSNPTELYFLKSEPHEIPEQDKFTFREFDVFRGYEFSHRFTHLQ